MKINLNKDLLSLDGEALNNGNAGKLVAQLLANAPKGDALKFWDWAVKLNKGEELDLDPSDLNVLIDFIKSNDTIFVIAKAQLLTMLNSK